MNKNDKVFLEAMDKGEYMNIPIDEDFQEYFQEDFALVDNAWASWEEKRSRGKKGKRKIANKIRDNRSQFLKADNAIRYGKKNGLSESTNFRNESVVLSTKLEKSSTGSIYRRVVWAEFKPVKRWRYFDEASYPTNLSMNISIVRLVYIDSSDRVVDYHGRYSYLLQEDFKVLNERPDLNFYEEVDKFTKSFDTETEYFDLGNAKRFFYGKEVIKGFVGNISLNPRDRYFSEFHRRDELYKKNDKRGLKQAMIDFEDHKDLIESIEYEFWIDDLSNDCSPDYSRDLNFFDFSIDGVQMVDYTESDFDYSIYY